MATISLKVRERIAAAYDRKKETQEQLAERFNVSFGFVKKLLAQRAHTGDLAPRHHFSGRKPKLLPEHRKKLGALVRRNSSITLRELRDEIGVECTLAAIHHVLKTMGLTGRKPRRPAARKVVPAKTAKTGKAKAKPKPAPRKKAPR